MFNKRICYVSPLSIHSHRWIEAFYQKGYNVSLVTDSKTLIAPTINFAPVYTLRTLNMKTFPILFIPNTFKMGRILRKINPNLVHLHVHHFYSPAIFLSDFNYILTSWGIEVLRLPHADVFRRSIAKIAAIKAQRITVDAKCLKEIWIKMGVPANKIAVIPFGVDTEAFNPNVNRHIIRKKLGIERRDTVITSTRLFIPNYDVECLIKAIPLIVKNHENAKFIIKGAGPLERYLKDLARKLNVQRYVHFVGLVPYNEIPQYLSAADVYVSTRFMDSTSVSLLEAMACGLAPTVTDIPANREWIQNGVNGFLFQAKSPTALAEKVTQLIEDPPLRKRFGERCVKIIKQKATWEKCVSKMEAVYNS